jgi:hypothetical protein
MMRMLVRSEWAEATLSSRVAPQEIFILLSQQYFWDRSFLFNRLPEKGCESRAIGRTVFKKEEQENG